MIELELLRASLGMDKADTAEDATLTALAEAAEEYAVLYTHRVREEIPPSLIFRMVGEDYAQLGAGGISSRAVSGMSEYYRGQYSDKLLAVLRSLRRPAVPAAAGGAVC